VVIASARRVWGAALQLITASAQHAAIPMNLTPLSFINVSKNIVSPTQVGALVDHKERKEKLMGYLRLELSQEFQNCEPSHRGYFSDSGV
jgi:hypothetical protein